jgi:hypothetical protein
MNQLFWLVQAVALILTCKKNIIFIWSSFFKRKYQLVDIFSFGDSPAETIKNICF